jgi:hypothetical protein
VPLPVINDFNPKKVGSNEEITLLVVSPISHSAKLSTANFPPVSPLKWMCI